VGRIALGGFVGGFVAVVVLAGVLAPPAGALPPNFEGKILADGLDAPTAMAWAPDGRLFVAEFAGRVRVVQGGRLLDEPVIDISDHVNARFDRGLLGIAVDADFETNHFLYLLYVYEGGDTDPNGSKTSRLTRVVVKWDNTVANPEAPETVILGKEAAAPCPPPRNDLDCIPAEFASHAIGTVRADADGTLWVGSGDATHAGTTHPNALRTYNEASLAGKLIHIDRDGRGVPGHPFCPGDGDLTHVCTKVYAKGFRNPFRFTLREGGLGPIVGDVGNTAYEEINLTTPGSNYGWPCWEGPEHTGYWEPQVACQEFYATQTAVPPDFAYGGSEGSSTAGGGAVVAGPVYPGGDYPDDYDGDIFYGDWSWGRIARIDIEPGGIEHTEFAANGLLKVTDLQLTPRGNLSMVNPRDFSPGAGRVVEWLYCPENCAPDARAAATPTAGGVPLTVAFTSDGSTDSDGDPLTYEWDFGDGTPTATTPGAEHVYTAPGVYEARLTVTDPGGRSGTATVLISAGNVPPVPAIDEPDGDFRYAAGEPVTIAGSATDEEDGQVDPDTLEWRVRLHHANHTHPFVDATGPSVQITPRDDHDADSHFEVVLTARDSGGLGATVTRELLPATVPLRIESFPPGARVTFGGLSTVAPFSTTSAVGFRTTVSAATSVTSGGSTYTFKAWSVGDERQQDIVVGTSPSVLTAIYQAPPGEPEPEPEPAPGPPPADAAPPPEQEPSLPGEAFSLPPLGDHSGPAVGLRRHRARVTRLAGSAIDPSGVRSVQVAVRARRRRGEGCRWWVPTRRRLAARSSCARPRWIRATLEPQADGVRWRAALGAPLPRGVYEILLGAVDGAGNVARETVARLRVR
jgi:glucose/arabinose dehydrogenase